MIPRYALAEMSAVWSDEARLAKQFREGGGEHAAEVVFNLHAVTSIRCATATSPREL